MPTLGGFLQGLGQQAGYNINYQQQRVADQAAIDLRQQQVAMGKLDLADRQQQVESRKSSMDWFRGAMSEAKTAKEQEAAVQKVYTQAMVDNNPELMKQADTMMKELHTKSDRAQADAVEAASVKHEATAMAASEYLATKSPESAAKLVQDYKDAGGDVLQVPPPGETFDKWAEVQQLQGKEGLKRGEFAQKLQEAKATAETRRQEHADSLAERRQAHKDNLVIQQGNLQTHQLLAQLKVSEAAQKTIAATDPAAQATTERIARDVISGDDMPKGLTKAQNLAVQNKITELRAGGMKQEHFAKGVYAQRYAQRQTQAGQILLTESKNIAGMKLGQTSGVFSDVELGKGLTSSLTAQFGRQLTATEAAEYNTSMAATGVEVATLMNAGQAPQKALIEEFQGALRGNAGDSIETVLYKRAVMMNMARSALSVAPSANAEDKANKAKIMKQLATFPTPTEVREQAAAAGHSLKGLEKINRNMRAVSEKFTMPGEEGGSAAAVGNPALPAGWK